MIKSYKSLTPLSLLSVGLISLIVCTSTTYAQSTNSISASDGSNESTSTRMQYIRGWRNQSNDLQQKINALGTSVTTSVLMPVLFGVEPSNLSPNFGDPRSNGRTHIGEDIMAVKGTPIISPTPAVVLRTGVGSGEGNYVYTANPGGETFVYMHLDAFGEGVVSGTVLEKGSLIGYVGNTGNASGGAAHLHFEIHDSNGTALDPYPRLTGTFTLQEKIQYLTKILSQTTNSAALATLLVTNFRQTFNQANTAGIVLPQIITNFMTTLPTTAPSSGSNLPSGDLILGSSGSAVVNLQQFLIVKNSGEAARRLSFAGATGNFGSITQAALIEYQKIVGVTPADGYYGAATRVFVESNQPQVIPTTPATPAATSTPNTVSTVLTRNLSVGSTGEDVRLLQRFLNEHSYKVTLSGAGSPGNETIYFGPATRNAVIAFQMANNISPAAGYVGPITRAKVESMAR